MSGRDARRRRALWPSRPSLPALSLTRWSRRWRPLPIRYRLALSYALAMFLTLLLFSGTLYTVLLRTTLDDVDRRLASEAERVAARIAWTDGLQGVPAGLPTSGPDRIRLSTLLFEVRDPSGRVILRSANLAGQPIPGPAPAPARARYDTVRVDNTPLRVYTLPVRTARGTVAHVVAARAIDAEEAFLGRLRWTLVLANAGLLVLTGALAVYIAGRGLRPLTEIAGIAREIGRSRDFTRRVAMNLPNDEVGQLAGEFNQMLDRIAEAYEEKDRAYRQAQEAYEAQRRFAADASHELRTPLTVLQANLELLQDDEGSPAERQEALSDMRAEVQRMSRLVNDLLVLARADAGKKLELRPTRLRPILERVVHRARAISGGRVIDLRVDGGGEGGGAAYERREGAAGGAPADITVPADPDALEQLLWILVENAVKYTAEDGRITVSAQAPAAGNAGSGGEVVLRVRDDGIGIEPDQQDLIFERFYRSPQARALDGSGLGLAIARWIVDQLGGRIEVSSRPGEGSEFIVRLPAGAGSPR